MNSNGNNDNRPYGVRTWIEISRSAIEHNYNAFRSVIPKTTMLMSVVKSNAYGHDISLFAKEMDRLGVDWLGVDAITEGLHLRSEGIKKPMLVLGYTLPERLREAIDENISLGISTFATLGQLRAGTEDLKGLKIHLKIDTGMHRQGFLLRDLPAALGFLKERLPEVIVEGVFTHLASVDNPKIPNYSHEQIMEFNKAIALVREYGFSPIVHATQSAGTSSHPEAHFDMVRVGLGMYGLWPSPETRERAMSRFNLESRLNLDIRPVLSWKAVVAEKKVLYDGGRVGYDGTEDMPAGTVLAVVPVGYWHGYPRKLSGGVGHVYIRGKKARVVGRVSMDMISVDITHNKDVVVGDEVELIGEHISAEEFASWAETINYEVVTRLNPYTKRVLVSLETATASAGSRYGGRN